MRGRQGRGRIIQPIGGKRGRGRWPLKGMKRKGTSTATISVTRKREGAGHYEVWSAKGVPKKPRLWLAKKGRKEGKARKREESVAKELIRSSLLRIPEARSLPRTNRTKCKPQKKKKVGGRNFMINLHGRRTERPKGGKAAKGRQLAPRTIGLKKKSGVHGVKA